MEDYDKVVKKLREAREKKGLRQTDLAKLLGSNQNVISRYELGRDMTMSRFLQICKALEVNPSDILQE